MTITLCEVGIHALFTGNVQSIEKEQRGKYKGESRELRNAWDCQYSLALLGHLGKTGWWDTCYYCSCSSTRNGFPAF